ncbi:carbohydrate porin [Sphingomonas sp. CROZ-RG-20F-R02-07]|uniref:carbohydrate porin n=1 Tax=Sphingomonas sp. CROZ-RG-20F-R02-07 TaxID=2914832 RepID=UPI001F565144|nr:carbohydrate porin [Sphingomonas sp. CROZ-RG-20F-R02-07]
MTISRYGWGAALLALMLGASPAIAADPDAAPQAATPGKVATTQGDTQHRAPTGAGRADSDLSPSALTADTRRTPPPGLIGDWHAIRTALAKRGIGVTARYASESAYNVSGGDKHQLDETGQFDAGVLLDLDKVAGLKGGAFQGTVTWRRGRDLGADAGLGVLQQVQEVYGRGQTVRVTQLWYEQRLGRQVEVKIGRTNPGEDFAAFSCHFENLSFCGAQPGNLVGDYWYNWPVSQWGARLRVDLGDHAYVQGAAYEVNPRNLDRAFVIGYFHGATGVLLPLEFGTTRERGGHVGTYKIGGWVSTARGADVYLDVNRQPLAVTGLEPLQHSARYGIYLNVQQQITGTVKDGKAFKGLSAFLNVTQADRATSVTDNQVALGLFYKGLVPWVPGDVLGLALARTNVNGRVADGERIDPTRPAVQGAEYAAEVYYSLHPLDWLELRPNLQLVHNPGGVSRRTDVGILGMKAAVTL